MNKPKLLSNHIFIFVLGSLFGLVIGISIGLNLPTEHDNSQERPSLSKPTTANPIEPNQVKLDGQASTIRATTAKTSTKNALFIETKKETSEQAIHRLSLEAKNSGNFEALNEYCNDLTYNYKSESEQILAFQCLFQLYLNNQNYMDALSLSAQLLSSAASEKQSQIILLTSVENIRTQLAALKQNQEIQAAANLISLTLDNLEPWLNSFDKQTSSLYLELAELHLQLKHYDLAQYALENVSSDTSFQKEKLHLNYQLQLEQSKDEQITLKLNRYHKHFLALLTIDTINQELLLDTGASISTISTNTFTELQNNGASFSENGSIEVSTAGGLNTGLLITIDKVYLAGLELNQTQFIVLDLPSTEFNGLLGMNILEQFNYQIDQTNAELILGLKP